MVKSPRSTDSLQVLKEINPLEQPKWVEFLANYGRQLMWALTVIALLILIAYRFTANIFFQSQEDYYKAAEEYKIFHETSLGTKTDIPKASSALSELERINLKHPELRPKYDGAIAQTLIINQQIIEASPYVERTLERTSQNHLNPELAPFASFAKTTLLITNQNYNDALSHAQNLKNDIKNSELHSLYNFNLLRIALLHQILGNTDDEKNTWLELQDRFSSSSLLNEHLSEGGLSLNDYIQKRLKALDQPKK